MPGRDSYVDAAGFADPRDLADHLIAIARDEAAYQRFFDWKNEPLREDFMALVEREARTPIARLCDRLRMASPGGGAL